MQTGCVGDCGAPGWQVWGGQLIAGRGLGRQAISYLVMNTTFAQPGTVQFGYVAQADTDASFEFSLDGAVLALPWGAHNPIIPVAAGAHTLRWALRRFGSLSAASSVALLKLDVRGLASGGAVDCSACSAGAQRAGLLRAFVVVRLMMRRGLWLTV
jgi:hypothetical protein